MPDSEKTMMLVRLIEGDPHVASELQKSARSFSAAASAAKPDAAPPTVAELQAHAGEIRHIRERKENERLAAEPKSRRQKRTAPAARGSTRSSSAAMLSGARWRPRSSAATPPAMIARRPEDDRRTKWRHCRFLPPPAFDP
ncbi:hypothetical protein [Rhizobium leguminosarum]|uniref:hypothetical protein n=1 Tax=Rhizobium leguminosarum TaxID=384 RepID=UPI0021BC17F9|nr:hypothetical protein [Rhizobium leguminosarum]